MFGCKGLSVKMGGKLPQKMMFMAQCIKKKKSMCSDSSWRCDLSVSSSNPSLIVFHLIASVAVVPQWTRDVDKLNKKGNHSSPLLLFVSSAATRVVELNRLVRHLWCILNWLQFKLKASPVNNVQGTKDELGAVGYNPRGNWKDGRGH